MSVFPEVVTASIVGSAAYEWLRGKFTVTALILIGLGAFLLFIVLTGRLEGFISGWLG